MRFCSTGGTCPACRICPVLCLPVGEYLGILKHASCCPFPGCEQSLGGNPCVLQPSFATHIRVGLKFVLWLSLETCCILISQLAWSGSASVVGFVLRGGFPMFLLPLGVLNRIFWTSPQLLLSASQSPLELSGPFALLISFPGDSSQVASEPRNFFLAVGGTEPELVQTALRWLGNTGSFCHIPPDRQGC